MFSLSKRIKEGKKLILILEMQTMKKRKFKKLWKSHRLGLMAKKRRLKRINHFCLSILKDQPSLRVTMKAKMVNQFLNLML
mmetsp:Transcript_34212/g.30943  ORF Transcript_34212/g.30943 Transcript_34212/m.30943 type:complete len:81 (-) Transcript_34212:96-338(-)